MKADIVLKSKAVFSGLEKTPFEGGIAICGKEICAVEKGAAIDEYIGEATKVLEYGDQLIMPGICEAHGHFSDGAFFNSRYFLRDIVDSKSEAEAADMVKKFAEANPDIQRIVGQGWFPATWNDAPLPSKKSLDAAVPDRPVYLVAADGHTVWMNSKAIEEAKVPNDDSYISKYIDKDENGELTGVIHEEACLIYGTPFIYEVAPDVLLEVESDLIKKLSACGITSFDDVSGITEGRNYKTLEKIEKDGNLTVRININEGLKESADCSDAIELRKKYCSPILQATGIKGVIDGVTSTFTGLLLEPYADNPDTCGEPSYSYEVLEKSILAANKAGFGVRLHCIGDGAVRWALDIFEKSNKINDNSNIRNTVEHIETIDPADIKRFKELNVVASMQPKHLPLDMNEKLRRVGPERCKTEWAHRSILDAGGILAFGTDFPIVDYDPFDSMYYAVTRNGYDRKPTGVNPEEKISVYETLRAYTFGGIYASNREHELGTLEKGKLADVAVLDRNLFTIDPEEIPNTKAVLTIMDGKIVYQA